MPPLPRLPAGAGGSGHSQSLRGGGGVRPPDGVQEYAPCAGAGGRRGIDGIEVDHPRNSPEDRAECAALCAAHGLIVTGGSDFHGANHGKPHPVGACVTADDQIARVEALARQRRGGTL